MADAGPWSKYTVSAPEPQQADSGPWTQYAAAPSQWDAGTEAMNAAMLGYGPAINGLLGGNAAADRAAHQAFDAAHPYQALGANVVGGAVPAVAMTAAGLPPIAAGAIQGGANGYAEQGVPGMVMGGAVGGLGAGVLQGLGALGRAVGVLPTAAPTAAAAPAAAVLRSTGGAQAQALRDSGAAIDPLNLAAVDQAQRAGLEASGRPDYRTPEAHKVMDQVSRLVDASGGQPIPIARVDAARMAAGDIRPSPSVSPTDAGAATGVRNALLDLYQNPAAIAGANPADIAALSSNARGNSAAAFRSDLLHGNAVNAENGAASTGTGMNIGNKYRQKAANLLNPLQNKLDGFNDAEIAGIQGVNDGTPAQNFLRDAGTRLGGGGGPLSTAISLGTMGALGAAGHEAMGLPGLLLGLIPPAVGYAAKTADNSMARRAFNAIDEATRLRSPLGQQAVANFTPPPAPIAPGAVPATLGGLLGAYMTGQNQ